MEQRDGKTIDDVNKTIETCKGVKNQTHTRLYRLMKTVGISFGILCGTAIIAFALTTLFTMITTKLPNKKGVIEFKISIESLERKGVDVVPGTEQSIQTSITNDSAQPMYLFLRLDCGTYDKDSCVYSFIADGVGDGAGEGENEPQWKVLDIGETGQIVLAWVEDGKLKVVEPQESVGINGTLTCVVPIQYFDRFEDKDMSVDFTGFGISTDESDDPESGYKRNVAGRGE